MKHPVRWILVGMVIVPALLIVIANGIAVSPNELPPPDPAMLITLPDGRQAPLFEILAHSNLVEEVTGRDRNGEPVQPQIRSREEPLDSAVSDVLARLELPHRNSLPPSDGDIFGLAEYSLQKGDHEQALALFRSLPKEHPRYGRAQRRIGWDIYTREMDEPGVGLAFVNRSVLDSPGEGNAWQDACRVYAATLGF